jgi:hypothetical protein
MHHMESGSATAYQGPLSANKVLFNYKGRSSGGQYEAEETEKIRGSIIGVSDACMPVFVCVALILFLFSFFFEKKKKTAFVHVFAASIYDNIYVFMKIKRAQHWWIQTCYPLHTRTRLWPITLVNSSSGILK